MIKPDASALENMGEFVRAMHTESGLIEEIPNGVSVAEAEYEVLEYVLKHVPEEQKAPLAGNTIGTDRAFLAKYMPRLDAHLHYRNVDVSSIKELASAGTRARTSTPRRRTAATEPSPTSSSPSASSHYYRRAIFVAEPGPSSQELQTLAAAVVDEFDAKV